MSLLRRVTILSIASLLSQGALAGETHELNPPAVIQAPGKSGDQPTVTPEPNAALLAGLGGLALLFFALRRK